MLTANAPADYGNVNGGGVVSILKSGTNSFHGSAYGYVQDYRLNANSWQNNQPVPIIPINPFSQAQFGGTFGGPIKRDKLFFFVDYLGSRYHTGWHRTGQRIHFGDAQRRLLRAAERFSNPIQLYDPQNGFAPYAGNKGVPIINPVAKFLFANPELLSTAQCRADRWDRQNNFQGPHAAIQSQQPGRYQNRIRSRVPRTRSPASIPCGTAMTDRRRCCPSRSPARISFRPKWSARTGCISFRRRSINSARIGFTRVRLEQGLPTGSDWPVRNLRQCQGWNHISQPDI